MSAPPDTTRLQPVAARLVRRWPVLDEGALLAEIDAIGRAAVEAGVAEVARRDPDAVAHRSRALAAVERIAAALDPPPPRAGWFARRDEPPLPTAAEVSAMIEAERDAALRAALTLRTNRDRIVAAAAALDDAVATILLLEPLARSVAREIVGQDPVRAALLRGEAAARLTARRGDLLMQRLVVGQALATIDLVAKGQDALIEALDRARTITVGAVRTATAARRAIATEPGSEPLGGAAARLQAALDRRDPR